MLASGLAVAPEVANDWVETEATTLDVDESACDDVDVDVDFSFLVELLCFDESLLEELDCEALLLLLSPFFLVDFLETTATE